jgi:hypothetical protein
MAEPLPTPTRRLRRRGLGGFGIFLARRGLVAAAAFVLSALTVVGFGVLAGVMAHKGSGDALPRVPLLASSALAFGVGVLAAFGVAVGAFQRDEREGVRALLVARGITPFGYVRLRVIGLGVLLRLLVGGGSLLVGIAALLLARSRHAALETLQATFAALVFGIAFSAVFAPVAMAALAPRTRLRGYLALLVVLVGPELLVPVLQRSISPSWLSLFSIPDALLGLRAALAPPGIDFAEAGRALLVLVVIALLAMAFVRAELAAARPVPSSRTRGR